VRPLLLHLVLDRPWAPRAPDDLVGDAVERLDRPLIEALERRAEARCAIHLPGHLLEWLDSSDRGLIDRLAGLVSDERLEFIGGGFYAPLLSIVPWRDAIGQQDMMSGYLERRTGRRPRGAWLECGVWEPRLAEVLADGGARYALLDDEHLLSAGVASPLAGVYVTEHVGRPLAILPIDTSLSKAAHGPPAQLIADLRRARQAGQLAVTLVVNVAALATGDGVEARAGALLDALTEAEDVDLRLPATTMAASGSRPRIYLPSLATQTPDHRLWQRWLVADGLADRMHKRMIEVSRRFAAVERVLRNQGWRAMSKLARPRRALYRGQYGQAWVGGDGGGLQHPEVRDEIYRNLIDAEVAADALVRGDVDYLEVNLKDLYADLETEILLRNRQLRAVIRPARGCRLAELEHLPSRTALLHVVDGPASQGSPAEMPGADRGCLMDRFLAPETSIEGGIDTPAEPGQLVDARYRLVSLDCEGRGAQERARISLVGEGAIRSGDQLLDATLIKEIAVSARQDAIEVEMRLHLSAPLTDALDWCVEFNLHPAADGGGAEFLVRGQPEADRSPRARSTSASCEGFSIIAAERGLRFAVRSDESVRLQRAPLIEGSQGGEPRWQGTVIGLRRTLLVGAQEVAWTLRLGFSGGD